MDDSNNVNIIDLNNNNVEYKGDDNEDNDEMEFYEYGAHFKYESLCDKLEQLLSVQQIENENVSTPYNRNSSHKLSNSNNKYITSFIVQTRNFLSNNNVGNHNKDNNNNINNKRTPTLSGNKNKQVVSKNTIKTVNNKLDNKPNSNKNKIQISNINNIHSKSNSKPKTHNNNNSDIKSISNKKHILSIPNINNNNTCISSSSTKRQTKLNSSYQNLCLNTIISPHKKPITQTMITNIQYKKSKYESFIKYNTH